MTARLRKRGSRRSRQVEVDVRPSIGGQHNKATLPYDPVAADVSDTLIEATLEFRRNPALPLAPGPQHLSIFRRAVAISPLME